MEIGVFLSIDSEIETSEIPTELYISNIVKNKNNTTIDCDEYEADKNLNDTNDPKSKQTLS